MDNGEFRQLEQSPQDQKSSRGQYSHALEAADRLRERLQARYEAQQIAGEDSVDILRRLREERYNELMGLD